jgi:hypothetical protein
MSVEFVRVLYEEKIIVFVSYWNKMLVLYPVDESLQFTELFALKEIIQLWIESITAVLG